MLVLCDGGMDKADMMQLPIVDEGPSENERENVEVLLWKMYSLILFSFQLFLHGALISPELLYSLKIELSSSAEGRAHSSTEGAVPSQVVVCNHSLYCYEHKWW